MFFSFSFLHAWAAVGWVAVLFVGGVSDYVILSYFAFVWIVPKRKLGVDEKNTFSIQ